MMSSIDFGGLHRRGTVAAYTCSFPPLAPQKPSRSMQPKETEQSSLSVTPLVEQKKRSIDLIP
jgi:hypothetical protein